MSATRETTRTLAPAPARRLFFALWPDDVLRAAFAHATQEAVRAGGGRAVPAHNLHVTLLFLGSIAESRVSEVRAIGAHAVAEIAAVTGANDLPADSSAPGFVFDRIELWKKPHVLVATTSAASGAAFVLTNALVGILQRETIGAGLLPDLKPFRPHVTIARKVARVSQPLHMQEVRWPVIGLAMMESVTLPEGPRYDVLDSWPLIP